MFNNAVTAFKTSYTTLNTIIFYKESDWSLWVCTYNERAGLVLFGWWVKRFRKLIKESVVRFLQSQETSDVVSRLIHQLRWEFACLCSFHLRRNLWCSGFKLSHYLEAYKRMSLYKNIIIEKRPFANTWRNILKELVSMTKLIYVSTIKFIYVSMIKLIYVSIIKLIDVSMIKFIHVPMIRLIYVLMIKLIYVSMIELIEKKTPNKESVIRK